MKTQEEIQKLKDNWTSDPCWEIEKTEGFEDHEEELLAYRHQMEERWARQRQARLEKDPVYRAGVDLQKARDAFDNSWPESQGYHLRVAQVEATLAVVDRLEKVAALLKAMVPI